MGADEDPIARLVAEGRVRLGSGRVDDLPAPVPVEGDPYAGTRALREVRDDVV